MTKLLLINTSANTGSTGRIAEGIGLAAIAKGYDGYFAYGRIGRESKSKLIRIGTSLDFKIHGLESLLLDNHGFGSRAATRRFVERIERIKPDVINLHNIHVYTIINSLHRISTKERRSHIICHPVAHSNESNVLWFIEQFLLALVISP